MLCAAVAFAPAASASSLVWSSAAEVSPPPSARSASAAALRSVSCTAPGVCVAVGSYDLGSGGGEQPLVAFHGVGETFAADALSLPFAAEGGSLAQVSCLPSGGCVAVGEEIEEGKRKPLVVSLSPAGPPVSEIAPLPGEATEGGLLGVSCPAAEACVAVGAYQAAGAKQPLALVQSSGTWVARDAQPTGARSGSLSRVACAAPYSCAATGTYASYLGTYAFAAFYGEASWATTRIAPPPGGSELEIRSLSCPSASECFAAGSYEVASQVKPVAIARASAGGWSTTPIPLPTGAASGSISQIKCVSAAECVAVGELVSEGATSPLIATGPSVWRSEAPALPEGATEGALESISCTGSGECVAAGQSTGPSFGGLPGASSQPATIAEQSGVWGGLTPLPSESQSTSPGTASLASIFCVAPQSCAAVGTSESGFAKRAIAADAEPSLELRGQALAQAKVSKRYEAALSATGGVGAAAWSVASGTLPPGLTLDPGTGAIAGTPSAAGTYVFAVEASDPGPPPQIATETLSIAVAPKRHAKGKAKPSITIVSSRLLASKGEVKVKLACLHSKCKGTLKMSARTKLVVKRRVKVRRHHFHTRRHHAHSSRNGRHARSSRSGPRAHASRRGRYAHVARNRARHRSSHGARAHRKRRRVRYKIVKHVKHRTHVLGRAGYDMGAGKTVSFGIFIDKRVIKLLKHHENHLRAKVAATVAHGASTHTKLPLWR